MNSGQNERRLRREAQAPFCFANFVLPVHFAPAEGSGEAEEFTSRNHAC